MSANGAVLAAVRVLGVLLLLRLLIQTGLRSDDKARRALAVNRISWAIQPGQVRTRQILTVELVQMTEKLDRGTR